ncbi:MAG: hypothetical protein EBT61_20420, partial [Verrucomicrobia bacterium]|nr:hypothetical protein [Verrucomicrobiota bacterium]
MKAAYRKFRRGGVFYAQHTETGKQVSLHTTDEREAARLIHAQNEAVQTPTLNRALGRTYLAAIDPASVKRTWKFVMEHFCGIGRESTRERRTREVNSPVYSSIRDKPLVETNADDLLTVLGAGGASVNHTLRLLHNLACGMGWLPAPIIASKLWPKVKKRVFRGVTATEHAKIVAGETNEERRHFYQMLWEIGAAQTDAANLTAENVNWIQKTIQFNRLKTGTHAHLTIGRNLEALLQKLPKTGFLFPTIAKISSSDRAAEFYRRCKLLGITGVSLHCYRYAWAERAASCGYPERFAQFALGHKSQAVHRAYAKGAVVTCPAMDDYEGKIVRLSDT